MTVRQYGIRLKAEGEAEVVRAGKVVGDAIGDAYDKGARAAASATAAAEAEESALRRTAMAAENLTNAQIRQRERLMRSDEAKANALRGLLDPTFKAQQALNAELAEYAMLADRGVISTKELADAQAMARRRFDDTTKAIDNQGRVVSLAQARYAKMNLLRQGADVFTTAAMGMNPAMIAIQQGPQILEAMADGGMKVNRSMLLAGGAIGAAATAVGVLTAAWVGNEKAQSAFEKAVYGSARAVGMTADELEEVAVRAASASAISVKAARDTELQYLRTGRIGKPILEDLTALTKDYAAAMGLELPEAAQQLAQAFARPKEGAHQLNSTLGILDRKTADHIDKLAKQGRLLDAQRVLYGEVKRAVEGAAQETDTWSKRFDQLTRSISNTWAELGKLIDRLTGFDMGDAEKLTRLRKEREMAARYTPEVRDAIAVFGGDMGMVRSVEQIDKEIAQIVARMDRTSRRQEIAAEASANMAREDALKNAKTGRQGPTAAERARAGEEAVEDATRQRLAAMRTATENLNVITALQLLEIDATRDRANAAIKEQVTRGEMDKALADQAIALNDQTAVIQKDTLLRQRDLDEGARDRAEQDREAAVMDRITRLRIEEADTLRERIDLEREILASAQFRERGAFDADLDARLRAGIIDRPEADRRRQQLLDAQGLERDALYRPLRDQAKAAMLDAFNAARQGARSFAEYLGQQLEERAVKRFLDAMADAWMAFARNSEGGGWLKKAALFTGDLLGFNGDGDGYARGTASAIPGLKWVGERGPELMPFRGGEKVWSHLDSMKMMRGAARQPQNNFTYAPVYHVQGSGPELDALRMEMARDRAEFEGRVYATVRKGQEDMVITS